MAENSTPQPDGRTHYDGCWNTAGHHDCARREIERLTAERDRLCEGIAPLVRAAKSWHDFHHGSKTVQCDAICEALPTAVKALAGLPDEPLTTQLPDDFLGSVRRLCVTARTTGGVAGKDEELCASLERVEAMLEAITDPDWQAGVAGKFRLC